MRRLAALVVVLAGCRPSVDAPASLLMQEQILAVIADPPEAAPGKSVTYTVIAGGPGGDVAMPAALWAQCTAPKPLTENDIVSVACLGDDAVTAAGGPAATISAAIPHDACSLFGPNPPPGMFRPRDPDATGGYFQPMRVTLDGEVAFALERLSCSLGDAPTDIANAFAMRYTPNTNPVLLPITASVPTGAIPAGATVTFTAAWTADSAETFPVFDRATQTLVDQTEDLRASWFVTAGTMANDRTDAPTNTWTAPATAGKVRLWVVLRDSRGGTAEAGIDLTVGDGL